MHTTLTLSGSKCFHHIIIRFLKTYTYILLQSIENVRIILF